MPSYVSLINWTEQGIKDFGNTTARAGDFSRLVERGGGKVRELPWTAGEYDLVAVIEFADEETAVAALLQLSRGGKVRTNPLRAFDADEMSAIVRRAG
jgi:uncharacterized protein with GYD domain